MGNSSDPWARDGYLLRDGDRLALLPEEEWSGGAAFDLRQGGSRQSTGRRRLETPAIDAGGALRHRGAAMLAIEGGGGSSNREARSRSTRLALSRGISTDDGPNDRDND